MPRLPKITVIGRRIDLCSALDEVPVMEFFEGHPKTALFCNAHMITLAHSDSELAEAMDESDLVFADGVPVSWLQSKLSGQPAATIRGYEVVEMLCDQAASAGHPIGLYGASDKVLAKLRRNLGRDHPGLRIAYSHAPPLIGESFSESEDEVERINGSGISILLVALGCPKQEKWILHHRERLTCSMLGVGAAFGWLAGVEPRPPKWMEDAGLAWLYRWSSHPVRLFKRYAFYNSQFMALALMELLRRKG